MQDFELLSDLYKDANGFRPSQEYMKRFDSLSYADKVCEYESLVKLLDENIQKEKLDQENSLAKFKARVATNSKSIGVSEETYILWEIKNEIGSYDPQNEWDVYCLAQNIEHYFYNQGISMGEMTKYTEKFLPIFKSKYSAKEAA